jgi:hypothetical protein
MRIVSDFPALTLSEFFSSSGEFFGALTEIFRIMESRRRDHLSLHFIRHEHPGSRQRLPSLAPDTPRAFFSFPFFDELRTPHVSFFLFLLNYGNPTCGFFPFFVKLRTPHVRFFFVKRDTLATEPCSGHPTCPFFFPWPFVRFWLPSLATDNPGFFFLNTIVHT